MLIIGGPAVRLLLGEENISLTHFLVLFVWGKNFGMENWKTKNATNTTKNFFFRRNKSCQLEKKSLIMSSKYRKLSSPIEPFRALSSPMITTQQQQKKIKQKRNKNKEMQRRGARGEEKEEGKRKEEVQEAKIEVEGRKSVCVAYGFLLFGG